MPANIDADEDHRLARRLCPAPPVGEGLAAGKPSETNLVDELRRHDLIVADGSLTQLGNSVRYHLDEYRWQKGRKGLDGVLELAAIGPTVCALDVGCGAGQTLRRLDPDRPVELFGIDTDTAALALGLQLAKVEGIDLTLAGALATSMPFRDGSFDLVVTRVALNYMHQRSALGEMTRVLRPGGFLFCRVERIWHDLNMIRAARVQRHSSVACAISAGDWFMLLPAGNQSRAARCAGWALASAGRLRRILTHLGCHVVHAAESPVGPLLLGRRTQFIVVARKLVTP